MTAGTGPLTEQASVHAELLDCIQVNLAVLADQWHGDGTHLALGTRLSFEPHLGPQDLPTIERSLADHLHDAEDLLGLRVIGHHRADAADLIAMPQQETRYVVADAFHLPWVPYHENSHMAHSFLIQHDEGGVLVIDGYHNDTPWGPARPGAWRLSVQQLTDALPMAAEIVLFAPIPGSAIPLPDVRPPDPGVVADYVAAYRDYDDRATALAQLTLETWLLARSRRLHAVARTSVPTDSNTGVAAHLRDWTSLVEHTYLAHRRVLRGRPEPHGVFDRLAAVLTADATVFGQPDLRTRVAAEAAAVLGVPTAELLAGAGFAAFPTFSSFRLVEIIERIEDRLGLSFAPDVLVPENLRDIDALCRIATRQPDRA